MTSGSTTTLRWIVAVVLRDERRGQPPPLASRRAAGPPARWRPSAGARPRPPAGSSASAALDGAVAAGQRLLGQRDRGRQRLALEQAAQQRALVVDRPRPGRPARRAAPGSAVDRLADREQLVGEPGRRRRRPSAPPPPRRGARARRPGHGWPSSDADTALPSERQRDGADLATEDLAGPGPAWPRRRPTTSVATRRSAGSARSTRGHREQVVADLLGAPRRRRARPRSSPVSARSASARRHGTSSADPARLADRPGSRGRRGSARRPGSGGPRRRGSPRRCDRPAGGERADLGPERGDRLLALGLDLGLAVLDDPRRLGLGLLAHLGDDLRHPAREPPRGSGRPRGGRRRAGSRARRAWRRPRPAWSRPRRGRPRSRRSARRRSSRSWGRPTS